MIQGGQAFPVDFVADLLGVSITAKGQIEDPAAAKGIGIDLAVTGPDLNKTVDAVKGLVPELGGVELPALGAFKVAAKLAGSAEKMAVSGLDIALGQPDFVAFALSGAIADAVAFNGVDLKTSIKGNSLNKAMEAVKPFVPELAGVDLPAMGAFDVAAGIKGSLDNVAVEGINVSVGQADFIALGLTGGIADALAAKGLDLNVALEGANATPLVRAVAGDGIKVPAFKVATKVSDPDGGYALSGLNAKIGRSDLSGDAAVKLAGARPNLTAKLTSNLLDLDELMPKQKDDGKKAAPKPAAKGKDDGRVFPDDPLPLDGLKAADATISFRGAEVKVNGAQLKDLAADVSLQNGNLALKPFSVLAGGGSIKGNVGLNAAVETPTLDVDVDVAQLDYGQLLKEMDVTDLVRGKLDVDTNLKGQGMSVRQIMAGLNGKLRVVTENGFIDSKLLNLLSSDLAAALTFGDSKGDQDIRCGVIDFDIKQGQAGANAIVVETGGISVIGEGSIDLAQEKLDLYVDPKAKNVSLVKVAMIPVDVGGTLASPSVTPNVGAAAVGAVTGAVGGVKDVAKGGLSGLGGLVKSVTGQGGGGGGGAATVDDTDYCKIALAGQPVKRVAPKPAPAAKSEPPAPKAAPATAVTSGDKLAPPPKTTEAAPASVKKAKEAIKGLKGLFK